MDRWLRLAESVDAGDLSNRFGNRSRRGAGGISIIMYLPKGVQQPRLKPGIAVAILRECLAALAALHRNDIIHCDMKPANIMLKRSGNAKIIDIGSAIDLNNLPSTQSLYADICGPGSPVRRTGDPPVRPGQPGIYSD
ncbi:MAG TPA: hypothetical protein DCY03_01405 [Planctomycetaceae bacterium]|nr:hypothetical protein [Planctomycetaceae bacterium]